MRALAELPGCLFVLGLTWLVIFGIVAAATLAVGALK
jgi:hypothetical protein